MPCPTITGVILAGGRASRLGGVDKGLIELAGKPLVEHVLARLAPQVKNLVISANRNIERYAALGYAVLRDDAPDYAGPLAGMLRALSVTDAEYILTVPCDCPCAPLNLAERMMSCRARAKTQLCVAYDGVKIQPVFALISRTLQDDMRAYLDSGQRKVEDWLMRHTPALADFSDQSLAFVNINTLQEHSLLEKQLNASGTC
ncbi:MAG: molybdenum cofactor guanylyltransferase MobA [Gammaproteobacteria bacterium]